MPMIKTCHAALDPHHMDGNLMMVMTGALALPILPLEIKTFCTKLLRISDTDSDRFVVYVFSELKWATDHETAVSWPARDICVCAGMCGFVCLSMRLHLCLHVSVCVCLCIIAPSHSNYKPHLIHFPIDAKKKKKKISTNTLSLCSFRGHWEWRKHLIWFSSVPLKPVCSTEFLAVLWLQWRDDQSQQGECD